MSRNNNHHNRRRRSRHQDVDQNHRPLRAYHNAEFLDSADARMIRILCEVAETQQRLRKHKVQDTIVFFGSARTQSKVDADKHLATVAEQRGLMPGDPPPTDDGYRRALMDVQMAQYYEDAVHLAEKLTRWSTTVSTRMKRFVICSGGGPGIMEAANRGAHNAGGISIGFNIALPYEQKPNSYQTPDLSFEFRYFFIRKFWFFYMAKALVVFPGGFGTFDELFELLTLSQTRKFRKYMPIVLYGHEFWNSVINFQEMIKRGIVNHEDLELFRTVDDVDSAYSYLTDELTRHYLS